MNVLGGQLTWTNNVAESLNHTIKSLTSWKRLSLTQIISALRDLVVGQHLEMDGAIMDVGQYELPGEKKKFCVEVIRRGCILQADIQNYPQQLRVVSTFMVLQAHALCPRI